MNLNTIRLLSQCEIAKWFPPLLDPATSLTQADLIRLRDCTTSPLDAALRLRYKSQGPLVCRTEFARALARLGLRLFDLEPPRPIALAATLAAQFALQLQDLPAEFPPPLRASLQRAKDSLLHYAAAENQDLQLAPDPEQRWGCGQQRRLLARERCRLAANELMQYASSRSSTSAEQLSAMPFHQQLEVFADVFQVQLVVVQPFFSAEQLENKSSADKSTDRRSFSIRSVRYPPRTAAGAAAAVCPGQTFCIAIGLYGQNSPVALGTAHEMEEQLFLELRSENERYARTAAAAAAAAAAQQSDEDEGAPLAESSRSAAANEKVQPAADLTALAVRSRAQGGGHSLKVPLRVLAERLVPTSASAIREYAAELPPLRCDPRSRAGREVLSARALRMSVFSAGEQATAAWRACLALVGTSGPNFHLAPTTWPCTIAISERSSYNCEVVSCSRRAPRVVFVTVHVH
jgi:hypothetical protein